MGAGVDVVSGGELFRAQRAGFAGTTSFSAESGRRRRELREALKAGVLMVNVESEANCGCSRRVAGELGIMAPVGCASIPK